ncbi:MAG: hypothetical protein HY073_00285 [Deltaproteobacteria bacterium]|nr:hypothetical protein [Deltaproteobacteria bacterium]
MKKNMKSQLQHLFQLNQLDLKIHEFEDTLASIPGRQGEIESLLGEKRKALELKTKILAELEKTKRDKEGDVAMAEARLKDFQGKLSQIKTNKEYQAALKELADTKKGNKAIEDQILEAMTSIEAIKKEKEEIESSLKEQETSFEKERQDLEAKERSLQGAILEVDQEKQKILAQLDAKILSVYQRIKKVKRDAVSFVEGGVCQGCFMNIPPQLYIEIQKTTAVHSCPSCSRILYLQKWQLETAPREGAPQTIIKEESL